LHHRPAKSFGTDGVCTSVEFTDGPAHRNSKEVLHESVYRAINEGRLEWCTLRIGDDGIVTTEKPARTIYEAPFDGELCLVCAAGERHVL